MRLLPLAIPGKATGSFSPGPAKQVSVGSVLASIQPTPAWLQRDRETGLFFEVIRGRVSSATTDKFGTVKRAEARANSTATTVSDLRDDFNDLLSKLRAAGSLEQ